jgi:hypothetical protein
VNKGTEEADILAEFVKDFARFAQKKFHAKDLIDPDWLYVIGLEMIRKGWRRGVSASSIERKSD